MSEGKPMFPRLSKKQEKSRQQDQGPSIVRAGQTSSRRNPTKREPTNIRC